jgi:RNA polymerase sigma factor (sigma-70 family)
MQSLRAKNKNQEIQLWLSFLEGKKDAFAHFYEFNYRKLYSYGLNVGMTEEQIKDAIQELFVKLYTRPELIKDYTKILPFLFQSIKNAFIDYQRYNQKYLTIEQTYDFNFKYSIEAGSVEYMEEQEHIKFQIDQIIESLTPRQKEIIYLRFLYHMEYNEISEAMDISEQAARNLTHRAIEKLRKNNPESFTALIVLLYYCYSAM